MDWMRTLDGYCERVGPAYWAEPINAVTNLAFIVAAVFMWRRSVGVPLARLLCLLVCAIGIGSFLFHTHAQVWAGLADVAPIGLFVLLYIYGINKTGWNLPVLPALALAGLFIPFAAVTIPIFQVIPGMGASAGYVPVPIAIIFYAFLLRTRDPSLARGLGLGAVVLIVSLAIRTVDLPLCSHWPLGTHFAWHLLNGALLAWMIEVYRRASLGKARA